MNTDVVTPTSLDDLKGPEAGIVLLPNHLNWSGMPVYDLSSPRRVQSLYATVVREALTRDDLGFLNKAVLLSVWSTLRIPNRVRTVWESAFTELRS